MTATLKLQMTWKFFLNPLTPVPPVTTRDEPWPFFLFWCHHFWPKLAPSILSFCRRKISFQWCPDQSDRPNGALEMHKNAQKVEWKTQSKIFCHCTWLLRAKNCRLDDAFSEAFWPQASPVEGQSLQQKEEIRRKRKGEKTIPKIEKPKDVGLFLVQNFDFCACPSHNALTRDAGGKRGKLNIVLQTHFVWIKGNLAEIQLKNHQNVQKTHFLQKVPGVNGLMNYGTV